MQVVSLLLRVGVLLCLGLAAVLLLALSGEYPGATLAGQRAALAELLPLALLPWPHLAALELSPGRRAVGAALIAAFGDAALLATHAGGVRAGAPPVALGIPVIAALLLVSVIALAWYRREPDGSRTARLAGKYTRP